MHDIVSGKILSVTSMLAAHNCHVISIWSLPARDSVPVAVHTEHVLRTEIGKSFVQGLPTSAKQQLVSCLASCGLRQWLILFMRMVEVCVVGIQLVTFDCKHFPSIVIVGVGGDCLAFQDFSRLFFPSLVIE